MTRRVWEDKWLHSANVKGHIPTAANEGFKSSIHMMTGEKVSQTHILPFGCLLYIAKDKEQMADAKFDSKAIATAYVSHGYLQGRKCVKEYTVDFKNKGKIGSVLFNTSYWADPTLFPFRKTGEERVTSLSVGRCTSGKEEFQHEIPLPPPHEDWINASVMENQFTFDVQQELDQAAEDSDATTSRPIDDKKINEIVGYNESTDQYIAISRTNNIS